MKEYPYKSSFAFIIRPIVSVEKDKYLASASLEQLAKFIPNFDSANMPTLLPIAFNAFVANRINKNDDLIDTDTAIAIANKFINVPINVEHKRDKVIGCVLTAGYSEFGTDKPLTLEQVKVMKSPFNVTLGGILWKVVNPGIANAVEESNDPASDNYMNISSSWELGFTGYKIVAMDEGDKNLEDGLIISDEGKIDEFKDKLKANGGDGKTSDDKHLYRMPFTDVMPLAMGLVENPAADVKGVATNSSKKEETKVEEKSEPVASVEDEKETPENNISQLENTVVNKEREITAMKFNSIKDVTDDSLKQATASQISDLFSAELTQKSKEWEAEKNKIGDQLSKATEVSEKAVADLETLKKEMAKAQSALDALNKEKEEAAKVASFNSRMTEINEIYELDDEVRAAILDEVKAIASDEDFGKWKKKAEAIFKPFKKGKKGEKPAPCEEEEAKKKAKADEEAKASTSSDKVIDKALDNADKAKGALPNTSTPGDGSLKEKYASAFSMENFVIKV